MNNPSNSSGGETPVADQPRVGLREVLEQLRADARNNADLGTRFEHLFLRYLELDPIQADRFSEIWMWNDWPQKGKVGDVGIDLVARERDTGEYCAIQCKFYRPEHTLKKADIDSFLAAASREPFTSRMLVSTTDYWGRNALDALKRSKNTIRVSLHDLEQSPIDWSTFDARRPQALGLLRGKVLRPHQEAALADVIDGLAKADRGKLVMACGTGKTFTALRIAEAIAPSGHVLFLVPSLSLMSQSLREWTAESVAPIHGLAVCSDTKIGTRRTRGDADGGDITTHDLVFPATTSAQALVSQYQALMRRSSGDSAPTPMTVVFCTYQSIDAVSRAQRSGLPQFDLVICDEAHRTTGVTLSGNDESHFVKVHDAEFLKARKRLYMTATPRIYGDAAKGKAKEADAELCSMDDPEHFGEELHRLGFGEAVGQHLLSDYKVLVLAVDEKYVSRTFQRQIADSNSELNLDDAVKITGCWNGLEKRFELGGQVPSDFSGDAEPMRRAVAFSRSIRDSKAFVKKFAQITAAYRSSHPDEDSLLRVESEHVDGSFDALRRVTLLDWLKAPSAENTCRILSNARCLSEGVDVPALDAVIFLNPRNSVIDVVQSVGRVMRRADGKRYGYIILPVGIPTDLAPEEALKDNEKYRVVWRVLQALRAHDDRFDATINQIDLNDTRPDNIQVIGVSGPERGEEERQTDPGRPTVREAQGSFGFPQLDEWKDAIYGKIVLKCGDRRYWESWAKDVAVIAERHVTRITALLESGPARQRRAFEDFLRGLRANLNPAVTREDAIEMLSQHLITRPVFDALFGGHAFAEQNPVSVAMQGMLAALEDEGLEKETQTLEKFYASVRNRASGIDNAAGRQQVVVELYDKFFRTAFSRMAERLGIVYTPIAIVDFIVRSVDDILRDEFDAALGDEGVHIIDPFTGTGTFIVRILQSGLIPAGDLLRKYRDELHANEIVLLAYYIAAVNVEDAFQRASGGEAPEDYVPFEGIVLTDTFQLYEPRGELEEHAFPENSERVRRQKAAPIRVVVANPPYSAQQTRENDNNQNVSYPSLDQRIRTTYAERSSAKLVKNLYDSYVRAIRWASDRIAERGVVGLVTNGSFIDANNMDGLRACLADEFTSLYVFNLRGNQRTSGELSRREGGKVFGSGSRASVAVTLLVRNPAKTGGCEIHYHDIGDALTRQQKLEIVSKFGSVKGIAAHGKWTRVRPNPEYDWINQRDPSFETFMLLGDKGADREKTYFETYSLGVVTNRDAWVYNASREKLRAALRKIVATYNSEREKYQEACDGLPKADWPDFGSVADMDSTRISWTHNLKRDAARNKELSVDDGVVTQCMYRPFTKQWLFFSRRLNERVYLMPSLFPGVHAKNIVISVTGKGATTEFCALASDCLMDLEAISKGQCFPLYYYEKVGEEDLLSVGGPVVDGYRQRSAITGGVLRQYRAAYGQGTSAEDVFYYIYGVLHSPEYRSRFAANLRKGLPRVPMTQEREDFVRFSRAGRELAGWHLDYESVEPYPLHEHSDALALDPEKHYVVQKMTYARPTPEQRAEGEKWDRTRIIYNSHITLGGVPPEALEYVVNGKPAVEWILDRYKVTRDKTSGIVNDPNDWAREHAQPRYIIDLLGRVVRVSVETMKIVKGLPALNERKPTTGA